MNIDTARNIFNNNVPNQNLADSVERVRYMHRLLHQLREGVAAVRGLRSHDTGLAVHCLHEAKHPD